MLEGDSFSMNEPNGGRNREDSDNQGDQLSDEQANLNIGALKEKIQRAKAQLDQANEDHKQNVLHTETINMMSKYQLVFIKLEKSLCQLCCMVKERNKRHLLSGFKALVGYSQYKAVQTKYKGNLVGTLMKQALTTVFRATTRIRKNLKRVGWNALATRWQLMKRTSEAQSAISKQLEDIGEKSRKREHELAMTSKRVEELQNIIGEYNVREKELTSKMKAKDRQITALETEVKTATIKRTGSSNYGNNNNADEVFGNLEAKLRDLEAENKELHEQMTFADSNMGNFIKEMSDLLDSHELISTDDHNNVLGGNYNNDGDDQGGQEMLGKEHGGGMKGGAGNRNMIGNMPKRGMANAQPAANSNKNPVVKRSSYLS